MDYNDNNQEPENRPAAGADGDRQNTSGWQPQNPQQQTPQNPDNGQNPAPQNPDNGWQPPQTPQTPDQGWASGGQTPPPNSYWQTGPQQSQDPYRQNSPYGHQPYPQPPQKQPGSTMAVCSMVIGILALVSCCIPPLQLLAGAIAIFLAILSKKGRPFSGFAIAGLILGILSVICSILVFMYFLLVMKLMQDPQYAPMFQDIMRQYEDIMNSTQAVQ